jgi:hypothetical protein
MTESQNKQRRPSGQARGLRARNRPRGDNQSSQQSRNNNANRQRRNDGANKNGAKQQQRRKPTRARTPGAKLDSELDFRNTRPASLQQQNTSYNDSPLFSQTNGNGNRSAANRRGRTPKNGQNWTPADGGGIYLHEQRGSDWYREDQARYAAKQIALENAELRNKDPQRRNINEAGQPKRPHQQRNNRNRLNNNNRPRHNQRRTENGSAESTPAATAAPADRVETTENHTPAIAASTDAVSASAKPANAKPTSAKPASAKPASAKPAETVNEQVTPKAAEASSPPVQAEQPASKPAPRKRTVKPKATTEETTEAPKAKAAAKSPERAVKKKTATRSKKTTAAKDEDKPAE